MLSEPAMPDPLRVLGPHGLPAAELVADALAASDAVGAALLRAQAAWLRTGDDATRADARSVTDATLCDPDSDDYRSTIPFTDVFSRNLTVLDRRGDRWAWLYDDDIVSLVDSGRADPRRHASAWDANTRADEAVRALLESRAGAAVREIRLLVFEGTRRIGATLATLGAADRVSHLELRLQRRRDPIRPVAELFPALRGLSCSADELEALLAREVPSLRALVVRGPVDASRLLPLLARVPGLGYLGLQYARFAPETLDQLLGHPALRDLAALELFDVDGAREFPFEALLASRARWEQLQLIALLGHLVGPTLRARIAGDPRIVLVDHDRRQLLALDFETTGWAYMAR